MAPQTPQRSARPGEAGALLVKRADRRRILDSMSGRAENTSRVVDWDAGERRRRRLEVELGRIVAALPRLDVQRAIVFGSAARGEVRGQSDLDLILIVDGREPFSECCARFYGALKPSVGLDLSIPLRNSRPCVRLHSWPGRWPAAGSSMRPDPGREGRRWLAQADNDLAFTALAARERFFAQACFNAQQAAGKALKAFLYARGAEHVLGHSVADLIAECAGLDEALATLQGRVAALDQFYVATRYPNTLPGGIPAEAFGQADAARALGMAGEVLDAVKRALG